MQASPAVHAAGRSSRVVLLFSIIPYKLFAGVGESANE